MRGILIVNPNATTMAGDTPELVTDSLDGLVDLDVQHTRHRGHARELAEKADSELVLVLGGDGVLNEAVNGIMARPPTSVPPLIGVIPSGGGNVFARAIGMPVSAEAAIAKIRDVIGAGRYLTVGLGLAGDRYFTFSADLGLDAEVMHEMDQLREAGRRQSTPLYVRTIVRQLYRGTDRRVPALTLERDGQPPAGGLFMTVVTNRSPWTYVGGRALLPAPNPDLSSGLDLLALRRLRLGTIFSAVGQMLWVRSRPPRGRHLLSALGLESMVIRSARPIAFQVDGEYLGETEAVEFRFVPRAIRVVA